MVTTIHRTNYFRSAVIICLVLAVIMVPGKALPFGKNKVNREVFKWKVLKTIHFNVYYPREMGELALHAARIVENGYVHVANYLMHELTQPIPVIVYPSHISFQENNIIQQIIGEGIGGFTELFKNRIVVPFTGSYSDFRHVLVHELVHAFHYNILFNDRSGNVKSRFYSGNVPLWLMEGMSEYLSVGFEETADMTMRDVIYNNNYASLRDLTLFRIKSGYLLYKEGQAFYYFLEQQYGKEAIGELFRDVRDLSDLETAVKSSTGKKLDELSLEWIRFFKKRYYPVIRGKNFDEEEGEQITFHQKTQSTFNICPAVSPDGRKIAYLTNRDIYTTLSIIDIEKKEKRKIVTLVRGNRSSKFEVMHLLNNYVSWSGDGRYIVFASQSNGRDVIFMVDSRTGSIAKQLKLPFRGIRDPSLSPDGTLIAFVGVMNGRSDVFIYDIKKKAIERTTDDLFAERYPKIAPGNRRILYSSNLNGKGRVEHPHYGIYSRELSGGEPQLVVKSNGSNLQCDISADGKKILYISNRNGIYNAYVHNLESEETRQLTDVLCGIFYPRWFPDGERIAFVAYQNLGYDIFVKNLVAGESRQVGDDMTAETVRKNMDYNRSYFDYSKTVFDDYSPRLTPDWIFFGIGGTIGYGLAGFARMAISDYMGDHRVIVTADYLNYNNDTSDVNFDAAYWSLKRRWDFGIGIFRQRNPYGIFTLSSINDIIHNVYLDTLYMEHYGAYGMASYPFSRFVRFNARFTSSRYERDYSRFSERPDIFANLNQLSLSLNFDNVMWGLMVPMDGFRAMIQIGQTFNLTGQDYQFTTLNLDLRRYFLISKKYVFAFRGAGGKIFGPESGYFKYYLGGFGSLRGHPFLEYAGENFFLGTAEFRFIAVENIKLGWPLFLRIGGIGGVLFTDFGSAWNSSYSFVDSDGSFDDFKMDMGFGFRLTLYPVIILKLDWAWPYYYKSFGDRRVIFSLGFEF